VKVEGAGLNLTRAALDAATKYPWPRRPGTAKFGAYEDDLPVFAWVREGVEGTRRCLETQVMDWADDVAYSVHDLEDGIVAGHVRPADLVDPDEVAALCSLTADVYSDEAPDDLADVWRGLQALPVWPTTYDASPSAQARLTATTSTLIGRFCEAARAGHPCGARSRAADPLRRRPGRARARPRRSARCSRRSRPATSCTAGGRRRAGARAGGRRRAGRLLADRAPDALEPSYAQPGGARRTTRRGCGCGRPGRALTDAAAAPARAAWAVDGPGPSRAPGPRLRTGAPAALAAPRGGGGHRGRPHPRRGRRPVRERAPIADVIGEQVQLRPAGGGRLKGLCPFHDEKTPSFNVNPALGYYMCFGCGESGDVISFVRGTEHLSFVETVERLASRYGVQLTYAEGGAAAGRQASQRTRLVEAHRLAAAYYLEQLGTPEAATGREFLAERGFDQAAAATYGVGYAPQGWDHLTRHLRAKGFSAEELLTAGLVSEGRRGPVDRFRGRLLWPIRDLAGDVVGFGARKLHDDDTGPKYLNTSETPIYKKSSVLYGLDVAKKEIAKRRQAVVVEGYTDVMACHLAGRPDGRRDLRHGVRRRPHRACSAGCSWTRTRCAARSSSPSTATRRAEGGAQGVRRGAALRRADLHRRQPDGMDPCELRLAQGDTAVRDMVAARVPLVEFALTSTLARYDLETAEGRVGAMRAAAPLVAKIKDRALRPEYARRLAGWLGMEVEQVTTAVAELAGARARRRSAARPRRCTDAAAVAVERELLKLAVQAPALVAPQFDALDDEVFTHPGHAAVRDVIAGVGGTSGAVRGEAWVARLLEACPTDEVRSLVTRLAVEAPLSDLEPDDRYAGAVLARVQELAATRATSELKAQLQRVNPVEEPERYARVFAELVSLESTVRALRERGIGAL
jgi:DNA primase